MVHPLHLTGFPLPAPRLISPETGLTPEPAVVLPQHVPVWRLVAQQHDRFLSAGCPHGEHTRRVPARVLEHGTAGFPALAWLAHLLAHAFSQTALVSLVVAEAVAATGRHAEH